jgi:hypothetical protein
MFVIMKVDFIDLRCSDVGGEARRIPSEQPFIVQGLCMLHVSPECTVGVVQISAKSGIHPVYTDHTIVYAINSVTMDRFSYGYTI